MVTRRILKRPTVFLVHRFETGSGKHDVSFGRNLNRRGATRSFSRISAAKTFAENKVRKLGLRTYFADLPSGARSVRVSRVRR